MSDPAPLDQAYLLTRLSYEPETGHLTWLPTGFRTWDLKHAGTRAGCENKGYRNVHCNGHRVHEARMIWTMVNGPIPDGLHIDHINLNRADNRLCNLRLATRSENMWNCPRRTRSGLPKGVSAKRRKFSACISDHGKVRYLGVYATPEEAHRAYVAAAALYHGEFARSE